MTRPAAFMAVALALVATSKLASAACESGTASEIAQSGITFTFDKAYPCGTFANGDFWVAPDAPGGVVVIQTMSPAFNSTENGWEVNPNDGSLQGFDSRVDSFDAARVPALPYSAHGGQSILKTVSVDSADTQCRPCLQSATVLTVLDAPPADKGSKLFRPPYYGVTKATYSVDDLHPELLPSVSTVGSAHGLPWVETRFARVHIDHKENWTGAFLHPKDNMSEYGSEVALDSSDAALELMSDATAEQKRQGLINYVQYGIDLYHIYLGGGRWPANGGHSSGRRLPLAFAGALLANEPMKAVVRSGDPQDFGESGHTYHSDAAKQVLFGQECSEQMYWQNQSDDSGARDCRDPYKLIDGGKEPGGSYQFCCLSATWKGTALSLLLMPELRCVWNYEPFLTYVDRWVSVGAWAQPDTCAPSDGNMANYGVTFGPDGKGGCIADAQPTCSADEISQGATGTCLGRWPAKQGASKDSGYHSSPYADDMWGAHRAAAPTGPSCGGAGSAGAAGSSGGGGAAGSAGASGAAGVSGASGSSHAGASGTAGHGGASAGSAGASNTDGGLPAAPAGASDDSGGCGCRLADPAGSGRWALLIIGAAALLLRRSLRRSQP